MKPTEHRSMLLNVGPQHPAMHGIVRINVALDGETVTGAEVEIGYLHRAFEKMCEQGPYNNAIPYTDRLNYVSPLINNIGYCMAVEKLLGIGTSERCQYIRVLMSELSRVTDHETNIGATAMELGAFTVFLYLMKARELIYALLEEVTGARLTISYARVGGLKADLPEGFEKRCREAIAGTRGVLKEVSLILDKNRIFVDRMKGTGVITREDAIACGITGPFLRGSGCAYDVRKDMPYLVYDKLDFDVPVGERGDNLDRYYVRMEEMEQSLRLVEQCLERMPQGEVAVDLVGNPLSAARMVDEAKMGRVQGFHEASVEPEPTLTGSTRAYHDAMYAKDKRVSLPAKEDTYGNIEGLMNHFKLVMHGHGLRPPKGEAYSAVEGANGELGFFVVSDGTDRPYRVRVRPPCFPIVAALPKLLVGDMLADIIPTFGSVNMIGGELDH